MVSSAGVCQTLENLVSSHKIVVISKSYCPYSRKAKEALASYNVDDLHVWDIDGEDNSAAIQECLKMMTGARTVPRVFIAGKFVGGGEETVRMHKSGKLAELIKYIKWAWDWADNYASHLPVATNSMHHLLPVGTYFAHNLILSDSFSALLKVTLS